MHTKRRILVFSIAFLICLAAAVILLQGESTKKTEYTSPQVVKEFADLGVPAEHIDGIPDELLQPILEILQKREFIYNCTEAASGVLRKPDLPKGVAQVPAASGLGVFLMPSTTFLTIPGENLAPIGLEDLCLEILTFVVLNEDGETVDDVRCLIRYEWLSDPKLGSNEHIYLEILLPVPYTLNPVSQVYMDTTPLGIGERPEDREKTEQMSGSSIFPNAMTESVAFSLDLPIHGAGSSGCWKLILDVPQKPYSITELQSCPFFVQCSRYQWNSSAFSLEAAHAVKVQAAGTVLENG